jgi:hypothetical protein
VSNEQLYVGQDLRQRARVEITTAVLDAMNTGRHDLATVRHARKILEAAGLTVAPHDMEQHEATRLRELAAKTLAEADSLDGGA